jgi:2-amino-4-hydroxy-6-hydroxymethyldihydropteridine diphosphokinase
VATLAEAGHEVRVSDLIETEPVGVEGQPKFLNTAAELVTSLSPGQLLKALRVIERNWGGVRPDAGGRGR